MLIVVVVGYRHPYHWRAACGAREKVHWDAAPEARHFHDRSADRLFYHLDDGPRCWQVHWRARGRIARAPLQLDDPRMTEPDRRIWCLPDDKETLLSYMVLDQPANAIQGLIRNKPKVDGCRGLAADHVGRLSSDMPSQNSAHV